MKTWQGALYANPDYSAWYGSAREDCIWFGTGDSTRLAPRTTSAAGTSYGTFSVLGGVAPTT